jgi:hypothetical protein
VTLAAEKAKAGAELEALRADPTVLKRGDADADSAEQAKQAEAAAQKTAYVTELRALAEQKGRLAAAVDALELRKTSALETFKSELASKRAEKEGLASPATALAWQREAHEVEVAQALAELQEEVALMEERPRAFGEDVSWEEGLRTAHEVSSARGTPWFSRHRSSSRVEGPPDEEYQILAAAVLDAASKVEVVLVPSELLPG